MVEMNASSRANLLPTLAVRHFPPGLAFPCPAVSAGAPLLLRRLRFPKSSPFLPRRPTSRPGALRRSISQVYSYGNVDYERRPPLSWHALYRRISIMGNRGRGDAAVLEAWVGEGRRLIKWELARVVKELRKFRRYKFSLQVQFSLVT